MNWEPVEIYKVSNGKDMVIFQKNIDRRFLVNEQKEGLNKFMNSELARKVWKEYLEKGYKRI